MMKEKTNGRNASRVVLLLVLNVAFLSVLWILRDHLLPREYEKVSAEVVAVYKREVSGPFGYGVGGGTCLVIEYRFAAAGEFFRSSRYKPSGQCLSGDAVSADAMERAIGKRITAWHRKDEPSIAVLDPAYEWGSAILWITFLVLMVLGNLEVLRSRKTL